MEVDGEDVAFVQHYLVRENPEWEVTLAPTGGAARRRRHGLLRRRPRPARPGPRHRHPHRVRGRGLGPLPEVDYLVVDVDPANTRSWRLLERLRFSLVWEGELVTG